MSNLRNVQPVPLSIERRARLHQYPHISMETSGQYSNTFPIKAHHRREKMENNGEKYQSEVPLSDNATKTTHSYIPLTLYSIGISLAGLIFGYDIGTIGAIIDMPAFISRFGDNIEVTPIEFYPMTKGVLIGIGSLGGCIGGFITSTLVQFWGPRKALFLSGLISILGDIVIFFSLNWWQIAIGRTIYGVSCGIICVVCPMLISDLSPTNKRGLFISIMQLNITSGILIGAFTMLLSNIQFGDNLTNHWQYNYPVLQEIIFGIIICAVIFFIPESPTWLLSKNRHNLDKAIRSIARCYQLNELDPVVRIQVEKISALVNSEESELDSLLEKLNNSLLKGQPKYLLRTFTGIVLSCLQQFTGINYFFFFSVAIFRTVGISNPYVVPIFLSSVNVIFSLFSVLLIVRYQRLTLLKLGSYLLSITMFIFTTLGITSSKSNVGAILMIVTSCIFIAVFAITWGPLVSIIVSELYPPSVKVKAMGICGCAGWISTFLVSFMIPILSKILGFALGYIFCAFIILGIAFIYFFLPETRHVEISALDAIYDADIYPRRLGCFRPK